MRYYLQILALLFILPTHAGSQTILQRVGNKPFSVFAYTGYGRAGYRNSDEYVVHVKRCALAAQRETKRAYGAGAIPVFLADGNAYPILKDIKKQLPNALVARTHVNSKKLVQLLSARTVCQVTMELFEGDVVATAEATKFLFAAQSHDNARLVLHPGYEPKYQKPTLGFRGASNLAHLLKNKNKQRIETQLTLMGDATLLSPKVYHRHTQGKLAMRRGSASAQCENALRLYEACAQVYSTKKLTYLSRRVQ